MRYLLAIALALGLADASATTLYKLTDRAGAISYVNEVPRGFDGKVQALEIDPSAHTVDLRKESNPRDAAVIRAETQRRASREAAAEIRVREATARVEAARNALEDAQNNSTADDWIYFKSVKGPRATGRVPKPEYQERLDKLATRLQQAEEDLRIAERG